MEYKERKEGVSICEKAMSPEKGVNTVNTFATLLDMEQSREDTYEEEKLIDKVANTSQNQNTARVTNYSNPYIEIVKESNNYNTTTNAHTKDKEYPRLGIFN